MGIVATDLPLRGDRPATQQANRFLIASPTIRNRRKSRRISRSTFLIDSKIARSALGPDALHRSDDQLEVRPKNRQRLFRLTTNVDLHSLLGRHALRVGNRI